MNWKTIQEKTRIFADEVLGNTSGNRRKILLQNMEKLEKQGISCAGCSGPCCTFIANSMEITLLEALDLLSYLESENRLTQETYEQWLTTIKNNRLDVPPPGSGKKNFLRRTYTCPFFAEGEKGCTISPEFKPYGCLGFNPIPEGKQGTDCTQKNTIMKERERDFETFEERANLQLAKELALTLEKKSVPLILKELVESIENR